jgi:hypothetical protein
MLGTRQTPRNRIHSDIKFTYPSIFQKELWLPGAKIVGKMESLPEWQRIKI